MNFAFDVDGTLTDSRQPIDPDFAAWFLNWIKGRSVYLVTGSDYAKTEEQVGADICNAVKGIYNCSGNAFYVKGVLQESSDFRLSEEHTAVLDRFLSKSPFPLRTGNHYEHRIGSCNFSIVGRNATVEERRQYSDYDGQVAERQRMVMIFNECFPNLKAVVGGDISIDIFPKGRDKSQVASVLSPFVFFGDKVYPGGNDYEIARLADSHHPVARWQDTQIILERLYPEETE